MLVALCDPITGEPVGTPRRPRPAVRRSPALTSRSARANQSYLRGAGSSRTPTRRRFYDLLASYRDYLVHERYLAEKTVVAHLLSARRFLDSVLSDLRELTVLRGFDVTSYIVQTCRDATASTARSCVLSTSSFLLFLQVEIIVTSAVRLPFPSSPCNAPRAAQRSARARSPFCSRAVPAASYLLRYYVILLCSRLGSGLAKWRAHPLRYRLAPLRDTRALQERPARAHAPSTRRRAAVAVLPGKRSTATPEVPRGVPPAKLHTRLDFVACSPSSRTCPAGASCPSPKRLRQHAASEMHHRRWPRRDRRGASPPRLLNNDGSCRRPPTDRRCARSVLAGRSAVSELEERLAEYTLLRRSLGYVAQDCNHLLVELRRLPGAIGRRPHHHRAGAGVGQRLSGLTARHAQPAARVGAWVRQVPRWLRRRTEVPPSDLLPPRYLAAHAPHLLGRRDRCLDGRRGQALASPSRRHLRGLDRAAVGERIRFGKAHSPAR